MAEQTNKQIKKSYRTKQHPTLEEREDIKARAYRFTNQTKLAKFLKTSVQNVNAAFDGRNTRLFLIIKNYVIGHEQRNGYSNFNTTVN